MRSFRLAVSDTGLSYSSVRMDRGWTLEQGPVEVHCCTEHEPFSCWAVGRLWGLEDYQGSPRGPREVSQLPRDISPVTF